MIFNGFLTSFGRSNPFLEDLGPFLRLDLGGKLGICFQLQAYINQRFLETLERLIEGEMLKNLTVKAIFIQGSH